jgi:hypothetical protein
MKRKKHRKPKAARNRTLARKRRKQLEYAFHRKRRTRFYRRKQAIKNAKRRKKAITYYRSLKRTGFRTFSGNPRRN